MRREPLNLDPAARRYDILIGTGGIGTGSFFALNGNHTLGREESRAGRFLDQRDYCKLHIITHYIQVLLGPDFPVVLIGRVGDDAPGRQLMAEMAETGLDTRRVQVCPGEQTMNSICFVYPDGTGGNLTVDDSACSRVSAEDVTAAEEEFARHAGRGAALAAPEVPLEARHRLLELATRYDFLRAASFVSAELDAARRLGMLELIDLLALNQDEAALLCGLPAEDHPPSDLAHAALEVLRRHNPRIWLSITAGRQGSWAWDGEGWAHFPVVPAHAVSTAGAGDAHLGALIAGLTAGLNLRQAQQLAGLTASLSVTSPHTIAPEVARASLLAHARIAGVELDGEVWKLLEFVGEGAQG